MVQGTAQFMARELLDPYQSIQPIVHEKKHDVESFIWVLSYCILRFINDHVLKSAAKSEVQVEAPEFENLFNSAFGKSTRHSIATERQSGSPVFSFVYSPTFSEITKRMSNALIKLLLTLRQMIHDASSFGASPIPLTHDALLAAVNTAIESL